MNRTATRRLSPRAQPAVVAAWWLDSRVRLTTYTLMALIMTMLPVLLMTGAAFAAGEPAPEPTGAPDPENLRVSCKTDWLVAAWPPADNVLGNMRGIAPLVVTIVVAIALLGYAATYKNEKGAKYMGWIIRAGGALIAVFLLLPGVFNIFSC